MMSRIEKLARNGGRSIAGILLLCCIAASAVSAQTGQPQKTTMQIRITFGDDVVLGMLEDSETARDFVSLLPLSLTLDDYASTEKVGYLPRKLSIKGAPNGVTPATGDIAYYAPWGNLALFHKDFIDSPGLVRLGRITRGVELLRIPGKREVKIEIAN